MPAEILATSEIPINDLHPHPENPNRGDVPAIAESLREHGQYRPIVVDAHYTILAGHHVWRAAQEVGWDTIQATVIDCDEQTARKILLADNRLADLGLGPDPDLLLAALEQLDNLTGTGFDDDYLQALMESVAGAPDLDDLEDEAGPGGHDDFHTRITLVLEPDIGRRFVAYRKGFEDDSTAVESLLDLAPVDLQPAVGEPM